MSAGAPASVAQAAVLSIGANLGDRLAALQGAVDVLRSRLVVDAVSPVYETAPVGGPPQPDYLNAIVLARVVSPQQALEVAHEAERGAHRTREVRFGPRTLDVDVITVADARSDDPVLTLPHPRAALRAFVLIPWLDVDPGATLPGLGPVAGLLMRLPPDPATDSWGVAARPDLVLR